MISEEGLLDEVGLEDFEVSEEEKYMSKLEGENMPKFASPEWSDYVLSLLCDDEKTKDGAPKTEGLIRVARLLFDNNLEFPKPVVHAVSPEYAAVTCAVVDRNSECQFVGSAEVHSNNTDVPYIKYPLATAETRALGRAIKRLLCVNVITAEETSRVADLTIPVSDENRTEGSITTTQIKLIERQCKSMDISLKATVETVVGEHEKVSELSHAEALQILKQLDEWKRVEPPTNIDKFDSNWQTSFN